MSSHAASTAVVRRRVRARNTTTEIRRLKVDIGTMEMVLCLAATGGSVTWATIISCREEVVSYRTVCVNLQTGGQWLYLCNDTVRDKKAYLIRSLHVCIKNTCC